MQCKHYIIFLRYLMKKRMTSPEVLYKYFKGEMNLHPSIICDLFGRFNWTKDMETNNNDTISLYLGLYKGLYIMDVSYKEIYRWFINNRLDELIHIKYSLHKSDYYREFCEKKIKIGITCNIKNDKKEEPYIYTNIQPPFHFIRNLKPEIITNCSKGSDEEIILRKIDEYKRQDKNRNMKITDEYVTISNVKQLLFKQENKCYVCGDNVITGYWETKCFYQFTLDRIDNNLPHNRNNVLICCYYCNCFYDDNLHKICENGCHKTKRIITRNRTNIPKKDIDILLLK